MNMIYLDLLGMPFYRSKLKQQKLSLVDVI